MYLHHSNDRCSSSGRPAKSRPNAVRPLHHSNDRCSSSGPQYFRRTRPGPPCTTPTIGVVVPGRGHLSHLPDQFYPTLRERT